MRSVAEQIAYHEGFNEGREAGFAECGEGGYNQGWSAGQYEAIRDMVDRLSELLANLPRESRNNPFVKGVKALVDSWREGL